MARSKEDLIKLIALVEEHYQRHFKEAVPVMSLLAFVDDMYREQQKLLFKKMLSHLPPDDVVKLKDLVSPPFVAPPEPVNKNASKPRKP